MAKKKHKKAKLVSIKCTVEAVGDDAEHTSNSTIIHKGITRIRAQDILNEMDTVMHKMAALHTGIIDDDKRIKNGWIVRALYNINCVVYIYTVRKYRPK